MEINQIFSAGEFGMTYERLRLEAAAHNIGISNVPQSGPDAARAIEVSALPGVGQSGFQQLMEGARHSSSIRMEQSEASRTVHDPSHPLADAEGNVRYPNVNVVDEMTTIMSATRAYEANVKAMNAMREMLFKALEIGGKR